MNNFQELRDLIYSSKVVATPEGELLTLNSAIDPNEGKAILSILKANPEFTKTIEIGCAFGLSSLYICEATIGRPQVLHTIIDPFQTSSWKSVGINNLKKAGVANFKLLEERSEIALPKLLKEEQVYDFALIDGWHTFDHTLIDFFYLEKLVRPGGIIAIDDVHLSGINKLVRYLMNYPNLEIVHCVPMFVSKKAKFRDNFLNGLFGISKLILPKKYHHRVFSDKVIKSDKSIGLYSSMVFFKKIEIDKREWNWFKPF